jgi:hypothetical protein
MVDITGSYYVFNLLTLLLESNCALLSLTLPESDQAKENEDK